MGRTADVTPLVRLAAACTLVMAWAVLAGSANLVASSPYVTLVVGSAVLTAFMAAAELRRTARFEARLAVTVVAALVVGAQVLVATVGTPAAWGGRWTFGAAVVLVSGGAVPLLLRLDARSARSGGGRRPYAR